MTDVAPASPSPQYGQPELQRLAVLVAQGSAISTADLTQDEQARLEPLVRAELRRRMLELMAEFLARRLQTSPQKLKGVSNDARS